MNWQDGVALAVCAVALGWLVLRLIVLQGPPAAKPDVTRAALVKKARALKKQQGKSSGSCH
ncbi:hypothetical protein [Chondromyces crocatus]|uniref:Uncharacterized protein n=1 Tax=Chondromyces crocatus TaxID=52 RepID=A0A0K1ERI0_CHOCO|nr:hypothetical protein [Chondromyces crocatus]AKT43257.1 uncharacterized protein CMC5_074880 [Chondromyces crocatus]